MRTRILIADDHAMIRKGVMSLLAEHFSQSEFGFAGDAAQLREALATGHWHVVVLDLSMPGLAGLEMVRALKESNPRMRVLVYTMHPEDQLGVRAIRAGADGFLSKDQPADQLIDAVRRILAGRRYVSDNLLDKLAVALSHPEGGRPHELLSNREFEILLGIGAGKTVSRIAEELHLSIKTVSTYRIRVLEKLSLNSNTDLVRYALHHHLLR